MDLFEQDGYDYRLFSFWIMPDEQAHRVIPCDEIVEAFNDICCPPLSKVRIVTETRKRHIRARWKMKDKYRTLEWWKNYFTLVRQSEFLCGRSPGQGTWCASFDWLIKESNFVKVLEGQYANRGR